MTARPAPLATLVYDGDCGFCTTSALWLSAGRPQTFTAVPRQALPDLDAVGLSVSTVQAAAYWSEDGRVSAAGSAAIAAALRARAGRWSLLGPVLDAPVVRQVAGLVDGVVARDRHRMPGGTSACRVGLE